MNKNLKFKRPKLSLVYPNSKFFKFGILVFVFCIFFISCQPKIKNPEEFNSYLQSEPTNLDPAFIVDIPSSTVAAKIFNGLVKFDENLNIVSDLVESYEIINNGVIYVFKLKKGVKFSNGREIVSQDVLNSFKRVLDPKINSPRVWVLDKIKGAKDFISGKTKNVVGIRLIDKYTIELVLEYSYAPFLSLLTMPTAYIIPEEEIKKNPNGFAVNPVGSGPYILQNWKQGEEIVLQRNELYFAGKTNVKYYNYKIIQDANSALLRFQNGELDVLSPSAVQVQTLMQNENYNKYFLQKESLSVNYLGLNNEKNIFKDKRVRQALNYAVDKNNIIKTVYFGQASLSHGPIPPGVKGFNFKKTPYQYKLQKAKNLLKQAKATNLKFTLYYRSGGSDTQKVAELMQDYFSKVGIKVKLQQIEWSALKQAIQDGKADAYYLSWVGDYPDAENFLFPTFYSKNSPTEGNRVRYKNAEVDKLLLMAIKEINETRRLQIYQKIENIIFADAPWVFLWHPKEYIFYQPWVKNLKLYPIYTSDKGEGISIEVKN